MERRDIPMPNKVRHLRGSDEDWAANDVVIDDGEIALALSPNGNYRMKIGNGTSKFSELDMFGGEVKKPTKNTVCLMHADDVRYGSMAYIAFYLESPRDDDFYAILSFDSGTTATRLSYPSNTIKFTGTSITAGQFVPESNMHYTAIFWQDGAAVQCHVRGYENA